jgi:HEPN domain-containing protein
MWVAESDLEAVRLIASHELSYFAARSKLAEVLEKVLKAELIRLGWPLEKTHDLDRLLDELVSRKSDLLPLVEPLCDALAEAYFADRYPGFDLDDPDWPRLHLQVKKITTLLHTVKARLVQSD